MKIQYDTRETRKDKGMRIVIVHVSSRDKNKCTARGLRDTKYCIDDFAGRCATVKKNTISTYYTLEYMI
jgi:hypothetical protein